MAFASTTQKRPSAPGLVPSALDANRDQPPVTPPPVKNVPAPPSGNRLPAQPNAPTVPPPVAPTSIAPPAPPAPPAVSGAGGFTPPSVGLSAIDPNASLRGQQILPGQDPRLAGARGDVDVARQAVTGFDPGQFTGVGAEDASTARARELRGGSVGELGGARVTERGPIAGTDVSGALSAVDRAQQAIAGSELDTRDADFVRNLALNQVGGLEGPNRQDLAQRSFDLLGEQADIDFAKRTQDVGRSAATFGRIGQGEVSTRLGTLAGDRERFLAQARERLGIETGGAQLEDQLSRLEGTLGAGRAISGEDLARGGFGLSRASAESGLGAQREAIGRASRGEEVGERGFGASQEAQAAQLALQRSGALAGAADQELGAGAASRKEQRRERDTGIDFGSREFDIRRAQLGDTAGVEAQLTGQGRADRGEFRGERGFQDQLARTATDDAISQIELENFVQGSSFDREQARLGSLGGAGFAGTDTGAFGDAARDLGGQADTSNIRDLMALDAARRRPGTPPIVGQTNPGLEGFA